MARYVTIPIGPIFIGGPCRGIIHVIEKGDTLYKLGQRYRVSVSSIMFANPYVNVYNLQIGDELCIPVGPQPREMGDGEVVEGTPQRMVPQMPAAPGRGNGTVMPAMPMREERTMPAMPMREERTMPAMPMREERTMPAMPMREERTMPAMPMREERTMPAMPMREERTIPAMPMREERTMPAMPMREERTMETMPQSPDQTMGGTAMGEESMMEEQMTGSVREDESSMVSETGEFNFVERPYQQEDVSPEPIMYGEEEWIPPRMKYRDKMDKPTAMPRKCCERKFDIDREF